MLAAVWWALSLGAVFWLMRRRSRALLVVLIAASVLLTLTRPTPYLILLPAFAAAALRGLWPLFAASCASVVTYGIVAAATHAYGAGEQLRWVYAHEGPSGAVSFSAWYRGALFATSRFAGVQAVRTVVPVLALAGAIYAATRARVRDDVFVLVAAAVACLIAIPFNPVPFALGRVVLFPLVPVFCGIAQCVISAALSERQGAFQTMGARSGG